jgi:hypothetical protein
MPWKETPKMNQKIEFSLKAISCLNFKSLCNGWPDGGSLAMHRRFMRMVFLAGVPGAARGHTLTHG